MQTYGILRGNAPIKNVTVTTFSSNEDRAQALESHASRIKGGSKSDFGKALEAITFANMRQRYAGQGAEQVRYFPIK